MTRLISFITACFLLCVSIKSISQQQKVINHQSQAWLSVNSNIKLKGKFSLLADVHVRRNNFLADPSFFILRAAVNYRYTDNLSFAVGYGHMWLAPTIPGYSTYSNENRIFEQVQFISKIGNVNLLQKFRNEQRWQEIIVSDVSTHKNKFSDRVRYLMNITFPICADKKIPSLVIADEMCIQFGNCIVNNTFDQNRLFIGIKQTLGKEWSFDLGYMNVLQQKSTGYQYDDNDTFRWFFYYTPAWKKKK